MCNICFFAIALNFCTSQNFTQDYSSTSFERVFSGPDKEKFLNQVVCQHMYRHGLLEIGEELAKVLKKLNFSLQNQNQELFFIGVWT